MDDVFEMTDEELAHIVLAAQMAARQQVIERVQKWVYAHCDLATSQTLRFMDDTSPHELLAVLWGERA